MLRFASLVLALSASYGCFVDENEPSAAISNKHSAATVLPPALGSMPGQFAVTPSGAATYDVPLWTPPGVGSIAPTLRLQYSSGGANSMFGVGWSLSGLSEISRCKPTFEKQGTTAPSRAAPPTDFALTAWS